MYSSPFLRCLQTADLACQALGLEGLHTHNNLCEFLDPGNRVTVTPAVPATEDITQLKILSFDSTPIPDFPEKLDSVIVRYKEAVSKLADSHWPSNILAVSHEICVREACKLGGCNDDVEATYCGHVELVRGSKDSHEWRLQTYQGVYKYDSVIE